MTDPIEHYMNVANSQTTASVTLDDLRVILDKFRDMPETTPARVVEIPPERMPYTENASDSYFILACVTLIQVGQLPSIAFVRTWANGKRLLRVQIDD